MKTLFTLLFFSLALTMNARSQESVTGNGAIKKEKRSASNSFDEVGVSGRFKVFIKQGSTSSIEVEADENLLPYIETEINGDELRVRTKKGYNVKPTSTIVIYVTLPKLSSLAASGASSFTGHGAMKGDKLEIALSGKTEVDMQLDYKDLEIGVSGSGNLKLTGSATKVEVGISGSADFQAPDLKSQNMEISISGSGNAQVNVDKKLEIAISGSGRVKYKGAASVNQSVSGNGRVEHEN